MMKIFSIRLSENLNPQADKRASCSTINEGCYNAREWKKLKKKIDTNQVDFAPFFYRRKGLFVESSRYALASPSPPPSTGNEPGDGGRD